MKNTLRALCAIVLSVGFICAPAQAKVIQVTTVSATASVIISPGVACHTIVIQNNGSGNVRLSLDGGTAAGGTLPTASTGYKLVAGASLTLTFSGSYQPRRIYAILESGTTTTLDIVTDDSAST